MAGLANRQVAHAILARNYSTSMIANLAQQRRVEIAMVYDTWFTAQEMKLPQLPSEWTAVATWTVPHNYVLGGPTVTFYALKPEYVEQLSVKLHSYERQLPPGISTRYRTLHGS